MVAILDLFSEFDDQDRVLTSEPDEHNEADLGKDVVLHRTQPDAADGTEQTHRDNENDRQRQQPTFIQRGKEKEDEENAERENVSRAITGESLLERDLGPFRRETGGQNLFGETFYCCQRLARARARREHGRRPRSDRPSRPGNSAYQFHDGLDGDRAPAKARRQQRDLHFPTLRAVRFSSALGALRKLGITARDYSHRPDVSVQLDLWCLAALDGEQHLHPDRLHCACRARL